MSLCNAIAQIGGKIAGGLATVLVHGLHSLAYQLIQMCAAGMTVAKSTFHHDLGPEQVIDCPSHADLQRITFWRKRAYLLRM